MDPSLTDPAMRIIEAVRAFKAFDAAEAADKEALLQFLETSPPALWGDRSCLGGHLTASSWVVNRRRDATVMAYHLIYDTWAWLGGHTDGDLDLLRVALRETTEESGLQNLKILDPHFIDISVLCVQPHRKKGKIVPSHLHYNLTFLLEADENDGFFIKEDENNAIKWVKFSDIAQTVRDIEAVCTVYGRLCLKAKDYGATGI